MELIANVFEWFVVAYLASFPLIWTWGFTIKSNVGK